MGREVRMVPANWQHPVAYNYHRGENCLVPLYENRGDYEDRAAEWDEGWAKWQEGLCEQYGEGPKWGPIDEEHRAMRYTDYAGERPSPDDYMPNWPASERTHYMMYEDTSEGTPISPAFETPEELARWLADNGASAFGGSTATYDQWLATCRGAWAPSLVAINGQLETGVEFAARTQSKDTPQ
jgi:hypothetical protein